MRSASLIDVLQRIVLIAGVALVAGCAASSAPWPNAPAASPLPAALPDSAVRFSLAPSRRAVETAGPGPADGRGEHALVEPPKLFWRAEPGASIPVRNAAGRVIGRKSGNHPLVAASRANGKHGRTVFQDATPDLCTWVTEDVRQDAIDNTGARYDDTIHTGGASADRGSFDCARYDRIPRTR